MSHHAIGLYHHDRTSSGAKFRKRPPQKTRPSAANMVKPQRPPRLSKQAKKRDTYLYVQSCERLLDCLSQLDLPCRDAPELETRLRIHVTFESVPHTRHAYSWCETRRSGGLRDPTVVFIPEETGIWLSPASTVAPGGIWMFGKTAYILRSETRPSAVGLCPTVTQLIQHTHTQV